MRSGVDAWSFCWLGELHVRCEVSVQVAPARWKALSPNDFFQLHLPSVLCDSIERVPTTLNALTVAQCHSIVSGALFYLVCARFVPSHPNISPNIAERQINSPNHHNHASFPSPLSPALQTHFRTEIFLDTTSQLSIHTLSLTHVHAEPPFLATSTRGLPHVVRASPKFLRRGIYRLGDKYLFFFGLSHDLREFIIQLPGAQSRRLLASRETPP